MKTPVLTLTHLLFFLIIFFCVCLNCVLCQFIILQSLLFLTVFSERMSLILTHCVFFVFHPRAAPSLPPPAPLCSLTPSILNQPPPFPPPPCPPLNPSSSFDFNLRPTSLTLRPIPGPLWMHALSLCVCCAPTLPSNLTIQPHHPTSPTSIIFSMVTAHCNHQLVEVRAQTDIITASDHVLSTQVLIKHDPEVKLRSN